MINIPHEGWYMGDEPHTATMYTDKPKVRKGLLVNISILFAALFTSSTYWRVQLEDGAVSGPISRKQAFAWMDRSNCRGIYIDFVYAKLNRHFVKYFQIK